MNSILVLDLGDWCFKSWANRWRVKLEAKIAKYNGTKYYFHLGEWNALQRNREPERHRVCNRCGGKRVLYRMRRRSLCFSCWFDESHLGHRLTRDEDGVRLCNVCHLPKRSKVISNKFGARA